MRDRVRLIVLMSVLGLGVDSHPSFAQGIAPYGESGNLPNFYNRQSQPLSPYLNLLRGGSPAVNYYYGVRPGLQSGGYLGQSGSQSGTNAGPRLSFFPYVDTLAELSPDDPVSGMAPTGHPIGFANTFSYFGAGSAGYGNRSSTGGSASSPQPNAGGRKGVLQSAAQGTRK